MGTIKKSIRSIQKSYKSYKRRIKRFTVWDIALMKWGAIAFGIIIGAYISDSVRDNIGYWVLAFIALAVRPVYQFIKQFE